MYARKSDHILAVFVFILLIFGLVMITSIGVPKSIQLSAPGVLYPNCEDPNIDCYLLFKNHLIRLLIGIVVFFIAAKIPFMFWKKISTFLFGFMFLLLLFVLFAGSALNTFAKSWLIFFNTSFQPTEFAKLALIFYFAHWMEQNRDKVGTFRYGFLSFCAILLIMLAPIILQPDLGSSLVIILTTVTMFFIAGAKIRHLVVGGLIALLIATVVIGSVPHVRARFHAFLTSEEDCREDYCWQTRQSMIAIGSGGFFGKGLTQGVQKSYWLPQATDDFIFAASAEELGFLRIVFVVLLYFAIAYRGFKIANHAPNTFAALTATGITAWITSQAFLNVAVNTGLFPVTGITLPFVSYGGSSLVASLLAMGVLINISTQTTSHAYRSHRGRDSWSRSPKYSYSRRA